uniref:Uncharacterized protein n=1 Tax=Pararge aegeria TaxID=116150 RepID=S4PEY2_9NEOP
MKCAIANVYCHTKIDMVKLSKYINTIKIKYKQFQKKQCIGIHDTKPPAFEMQITIIEWNILVFVECTYYTELLNSYQYININNILTYTLSFFFFYMLKRYFTTLYPLYIDK